MKFFKCNFCFFSIDFAIEQKVSVASDPLLFVCLSLKMADCARAIRNGALVSTGKYHPHFVCQVIPPKWVDAKVITSFGWRLVFLTCTCGADEWVKLSRPKRIAVRVSTSLLQEIACQCDYADSVSCHPTEASIPVLAPTESWYSIYRSPTDERLSWPEQCEWIPCPRKCR